MADQPATRVIAGYAAHEYVVPVGGRDLRIYGPREPHALNREPAVVARAAADSTYKPHWAVPWPAAVMLAEHALGRLGWSADPVLEVGAGLGIPGLALASRGWRVISTDYDEAALEYVRASAALNGIHLEGVQRLDWRAPPRQRFATILAAEVIYDRRHHDPVLRFLRQCLHPRGVALLSDMNRRAADTFIGSVVAAGMCCAMVPAAARAIPGAGARDERMMQGRVFEVTWGVTAWGC